MKIAFINNNGNVGGHLGHARVITIYDDSSKSFTDHSPEVTGGGDRSIWLSNSGVSSIILSSSGVGALKHLSNLGISVLDGRDYTIQDALDMFLLKELCEFSIDKNPKNSSDHGECCEGDDCCRK